MRSRCGTTTYLGGLLSDTLSFRVVYLVAALFVFAALIVAGVIGIVALVKPPARPMRYPPHT